MNGLMILQQCRPALGAFLRDIDGKIAGIPQCLALGTTLLQGFSYLSEVRARGLLNLGKRAFGPSKLVQSKRTEKNWTAILFALQTIYEISSV